MSECSRPRIGVIGTGAIGGFYGLMLARAGFDVHFLLRSEYDAVKAHGLHIESAVHGELHLQEVQAYCDVAQMPPCDVILVGAKTTSNAELAPLIQQLAAPGAKVLLLQNGLAVEQALRPLLPEHIHLLGGLCFICVYRKEPGRVVHQAQGMINIGYHSGPADMAQSQSVTQDIIQMFVQASVPSSAMDSLEHARWHKLVWNMPFNGLSVVLNASTNALMGSVEARALLKDLMFEVVKGAKACGHELPEQLVDMLLLGTERIPDYLPSMYHDFEQQRPMELQALFVEPLAAAQAQGVDLPKLRQLYQQLCFLEQRSLA